MADLKTYPHTPDFVKKRNYRLLNFFNSNGFSNEIRLIGDENSPAILYADEFVLSCYVKNFDLIFVDSLVDGKEVKRYKLQEIVPAVKEELRQLIKTLPLKKTFRIRLTNQNLFLVGWTKTSGEASPVFGKIKPKVYFDRNKAQQTADSLTYNCEIL